MLGGQQLSTSWNNASRLTRVASVVVGAIIISSLTFGAVGCGSGDGSGTATPSGPTPIPDPPRPTVEQVLRYFAAILPTATSTPAYTGGGTTGGSASHGGGGTYTAPQGGSGPGAITGTDIRLSIPKIGIDTGVNGRSVGTNGVMGDPSGPWMVVWYDFSPFSSGVGGYPGEPGANVIMAGHVDYIRVGPAVFWGIKSLAPGDQITVTGANGPVTYAVQWVDWASPSVDFTTYVTKQGQETITLVTCVGSFSGGHYSNRLVVRGVRI